MKAVCLLGSPRLDGNTGALVAEMIRPLQSHGAEVIVHSLSALEIGYCQGCKACCATGKCAQKDDVERIMQDVTDAKLVIAASPSYWGDVTGQMKVFMDRCTPYGNTNPARMPLSFTAKGAAVAVRAGRSKQESLHLVGTMEHFLGHLDIPLVSFFTAEGLDSREDLLSRPELLEDARAFGESLCQWLA